MKIQGFVAYGKEGGRTAILVPAKLQGIIHSWIHHDRCTALLVKKILPLSVYLSHERYDEEVYDIVIAT